MPIGNGWGLVPGLRAGGLRVESVGRLTIDSTIQTGEVLRVKEVLVIIMQHSSSKPRLS